MVIGNDAKEIFMASFQKVQKNCLGDAEVNNEKTYVNLSIENRSRIFHLKIINFPPESTPVQFQKDCTKRLNV